MNKIRYTLIVGLMIGLIVMTSSALGLFDELDSNVTDNPASSSELSNSNSDSSSSAVAVNLIGDPPPYVDDVVGSPLASTDLVDKVGPAVVSIVSESVSYYGGIPVPGKGAGTGIIISPDGYVVTNNHVVEGASKVTVTLSDGRVFDSIRVTTDPLTDLAVVQIDAKDLPYLHLLDNSLDQLNVLDPVVAVGNALALSGGATWTTGVVSSLGRSIDLGGGEVLYDIIQTDAAINHGNSGGPLVNWAGQVVGINVAIASDAENIGFTISTNTAVDVIKTLIEKGKIVRPWLGVRMVTVNATIAQTYKLSVNSGVLIIEVVAGSPAEKSGLMVNDVIVSIGGQTVITSEELRNVVSAHKVGDKIEIVYIRGSEQKTTSATLAQALS